jgi:8-oxo-dGTP diphosphatase
MKNTFYEFILRVQAISKIGLLYSKDPYALENYQELNHTSSEMLKTFMDVDFSRPNYFAKEAYPTPNVSVRVIIMTDDQKVLYVKEKDGGGYTLPGGWADINQSPVDAAVTECLQEAGAVITIDKLVGVYNFTSQKVSSSQYCLVFKARVVGPLVAFGHEITDILYSPYDVIPEPVSWKLSKVDIVRMIKDSFKEGAHYE